MEKKIFRQLTVVQQVMEEIKDLIASGRFSVNDQIPPENELADMFGVSRPTIREAIKIFNYLGILKSQTGKGTYVSNRANISTEALTWSILLGDTELLELIEMREIIEERSIRKLTRDLQRDPDKVKVVVDEMELHVSEMNRAIKNSETEKLTQADYEFHACVIRGSGNTLFSAIYETLKSFMHEEINRTHQQAESNETILKEHDAILKAIKTRDPVLAIEAFRAHMNSTCWQIFKKNREEMY